MILVALDTNILAYAEGVEGTPTDHPKVEASQRLVDRLTILPRRPRVALQTLAELHRLLVRKGRYSSKEAAARIERVRRPLLVLPTTQTVFDAALDLVAQHGLQIFDGIILAAAAEAECELLLSEDMQDAFVWRGVTIVNPFGAPPDPRLRRLLG